MGCVGGTVEPPWGRGPTRYASYCNAKLKQNYPMARVRGRGSEARVGCRRRDTSPAGGCILTRLKNDLLKGPRPKKGMLRCCAPVYVAQYRRRRYLQISDLLMLYGGMTVHWFILFEARWIRRGSSSFFFSSSSSPLIDSILYVFYAIIVIIRKDGTKSLERLKLKKIWCFNLKA